MVGYYRGLDLVGFRLIQVVGAAFLFANSGAADRRLPSGSAKKRWGSTRVAFIGGSMVGLITGGILAGIPDLHFGP